MPVNAQISRQKFSCNHYPYFVAKSTQRRGSWHAGGRVGRDEAAPEGAFPPPHGHRAPGFAAGGPHMHSMHQSMHGRHHGMHDYHGRHEHGPRHHKPHGPEESGPPRTHSPNERHGSPGKHRFGGPRSHWKAEHTDGHSGQASLRSFHLEPCSLTLQMRDTCKPHIKGLR